MRNTTKTLSIASTVLRIGVACTFVVAGSLKLKDPQTFAEQIANYQLLPEFSNFIAASLPTLELCAALIVIAARGSLRWAGAAIVGGMLAVFTAALIRAWALGINLECGCFGVGSTDIGPWPVLRNLSLLSALGLAYYLELRSGKSAFATAPSVG